MSALLELEETVQQIAEAIASALKLDVTIADNKLVRIAGTGSYRDMIGSQIPSGTVFEKCLKQKSPYTCDKFSSDHNCTECPNRDNCRETAHICYPILMDDRAEGVISIVTFDPDKRNELINNKDDYLNFIKKMADLISSKIKEQRTFQQLLQKTRELEVIINSVDDGILSMDMKGNIIYANTTAKMLFHLDEGFKAKNIKEYFDSGEIYDSIVNKYEVKDLEESFNLKGKKVTFLVQSKLIKVDNRHLGIIFTFKNLKRVQKSVYKTLENSRQLTFSLIIGESPKLLKAKKEAKIAAKSHSTVLLMGESGTGKELFARAIHNESPRKNQSFVPINCAAIPDTLLESELFGYEKGAFTGADKRGKPGKFELADKGTIFLDEIGDMPLYLQSKLLRVIQEKKVYRIGGLKPVEVDVRIIAATNKDLSHMVEKGNFRPDLYYRLNVIPIIIPPLRERKEDLAPLMNYFLQKYNRIMKKNILGFAPDVIDLFYNYSWPGNIRELENLIEYCVNFETSSIITRDILSSRFKEIVEQKNSTSLKEQLKNLERKIILDKLKFYGDTTEGKKAAACDLKIGIATLYRKMKELGISEGGD